MVATLPRVCLLVTEEEVYAYNILNDWPFPDHMNDQGVIFAARELAAILIRSRDLHLNNILVTDR